MPEDVDFDPFEEDGDVEEAPAKPVSAARQARLDARGAVERAHSHLQGRSGLSDEDKADKLASARSELQAALDALATVS